MQMVLARLQVAGELAQRLRHEARLEADVRVAHLALDLRLRHQGRHRVDRDHVERRRPDEQVGDLERLLAVVGLRQEELVDVDADGLRVGRVHRVLGVDEGAQPAALLGLGDQVVDHRRLTGALRAVDLDDPAARDAADAERDVERQRPRRDGGHLRHRAVPHPHDGALAELPLDLRDGRAERLVLLHGGPPLEVCR